MALSVKQLSSLPMAFGCYMNNQYSFSERNWPTGGMWEMTGHVEPRGTGTWGGVQTVAGGWTVWHPSLCPLTRAANQSQCPRKRDEWVLLFPVIVTHGTCSSAVNKINKLATFRNRQLTPFTTFKVTGLSILCGQEGRRTHGFYYYSLYALEKIKKTALII